MLRVATSGLYRATGDGRFLGYGPARAGHGHFRIDEWPLKDIAGDGKHVIGIEVAASLASSYYMIKQPAFLQAEIVSGDKVLAATRDFVAIDLHPVVVRKVPRYSYQRTFIEAFRPTPGWNAAWRSAPQWQDATLKLVETPAVSLTSRSVPYPDFKIIDSKCIASGGFKVLSPVPKRTYYGFSSKGTGDFPEVEMEARPDLLMSSVETTSLKEGPAGPVIEPGNFLLHDFGTYLSGFLGFKLHTDKPARLLATFDELRSGPHGSVNSHRMNCINAIQIDLPAGTYEFETLEPYTQRHLQLYALDGWIFVEWSQANKFVQDVNYPTNMLYAAAVDAASRIYQRDDWHKKADGLRATINRQSFDGNYYRDHAKRLPDGKLDILTDRTEVCQYYAFFLGTATPESQPKLWKSLVEDFGPSRRETKAHPEIHPCNQLPGNMLRMEILSRYGETARIHDEAIGYWNMMAATTGTLWEHDKPEASCNHGFASHAAVVLRRDLLGLRNIDPQKKTVEFSMPENPLKECRGSFPTADGNTSLSDDHFDKSFFSVKIDKDWDLGNFISWFQCRSFENDPSSGGLQIVVGHPLVHEPELSKIRFEYRAQNVSARQILDEFSKQTGVRYSIRPCAVLWEKQEAGNDKQPADDKTPEAPKSTNE